MDGEFGSSALTAATLPAIAPTVTTGPTTANVSWTPTQWSGSTYTLTHATDSSGTGAATAYSGSASSTTDNGEFATAASVLSHATAVSTATSYTCALTESGVWCWGINGYNQTGAIGSVITTPTLVSGLPGVPTAVSAGYRHACAVVAGAAWCWGSNASGQLGNGTSGGQSATPVAVTGLSGKTVTAISAGFQATCAIASGAAYCWGKNAYGEIGDGTATARTTPVAVSLPAGRVDSISTSRTDVSSGQSATTCAAVAGAAYCWGTDTSGQLGNGGTTSSSTPVAVSTSGALSGRAVTSVSVSMTSACATTDTIVACWGAGSSGQLGNGGSSQSTTPVAVSGITGVAAGSVSAALGYACAVASSSAAYCWGTGSVGTTSGSAVSTPTAVSTSGALSGATVTAISTASDHACALTATETVACWGDNTSAELGTGSTSPTTSNTPLAASALTVTGCANGAGMLSDGNCSLAPYTTYYWKLRNQLATWTSPASDWVAATTTARSAVTPSASATTAGSASLGWSAYSPTGQQAARYVLQRSTSSSGANPTTVYDGGALTTTDTGGFAATNSSVTALANGGLHSCALLSSGKAYCWGNGATGQLGNEKTDSPVTTAAQVSALSTAITSIGAGFKFTCAASSGNAYCWGSNSSGQLGAGLTPDSNAHPSAQQVQGITGAVTAVAAAGASACALTSAGTVYCWGAGDSGQLGNGTSSLTQPTAVQVTGVTTATSISVGYKNACALLGNGTLSCWGDNSYGQLGASATSPQTTPVTVSGLSGVTSMSAGFGFICAVTSGNVKCLGYNYYGQLGNGTTTDSNTPVIVYRASDSAALSGATTVSAGYGSACAVASGTSSVGTGYCWGNDPNGQLGDGGTASNPQPKAWPVSTGGSSSLSASTVLTQLSLDGSYTVTWATACATDGQSVHCWGYNSSGQVGNGSSGSNVTKPAAVTGLAVSGWACPANSSFVSALTCSLVASTTYYYRVTYYLGAWTGPSSGWVAVTTSSS